MRVFDFNSAIVRAPGRSAVLAARHSAGAQTAAVSDDLCDKLTEAAKRYEHTDDDVSSVLRTQMQTGQT